MGQRLLIWRVVVVAPVTKQCNQNAVCFRDLEMFCIIHAGGVLALLISLCLVLRRTGPEGAAETNGCVAPLQVVNSS